MEDIPGIIGLFKEMLEASKEILEERFSWSDFEILKVRKLLAKESIKDVLFRL